MTPARNQCNDIYSSITVAWCYFMCLSFRDGIEVTRLGQTDGEVAAPFSASQLWEVIPVCSYI